MTLTSVKNSVNITAHTVDPKRGAGGLGARFQVSGTDRLAADGPTECDHGEVCRSCPKT